MEERGDNIYFIKNEMWYIRPSYHYESDKDTWRKDVVGRYVLIFTHFYYFGRNAIKIPREFRVIENVKG
jgi:hypothetical protein